MNFVSKLKDEKMQQKLFEAFNAAYDRDFEYELLFREETALFTINTTRNAFVSSYIIENYDLIPMCPGEDAISDRYYGVKDAQSRKIYLSFMKKTFPEYKDEYIKNLDNIKQKSIDEINSL